MQCNEEAAEMTKNVLNYFGFTICEQQNAVIYGFMVGDNLQDSAFIPVGPLADLLLNQYGRLDALFESIAQKKKIEFEIVYNLDHVYGIPTWVYTVSWVCLVNEGEIHIETLGGASHPSRATSMLYSLEALKDGLENLAAGRPAIPSVPNLTLI